ncbi:hypothetical protein D3C76_754350 [compost metagenome]
MLAQLGAEHRFLTDIGAVEHKGIENFAGRTVVITVGVIAQPVLVGAMTVERITRRDATCRIGRDQVARIACLSWKGVGIGTDIVVGMVVPTGGTDPKAHFSLEDHIELGQQIDPLGHCTADTEILVAVVVVGGIGDLRVLPFHALAVAGLEGVIKANGPVFAAGVELEGMGSRQGGKRNCRGQNIAQQGAVTCSGLHYVVSVSCFFCLGSNNGPHPVQAGGERLTGGLIAVVVWCLPGRGT